MTDLRSFIGLLQFSDGSSKILVSSNPLTNLTKKCEGMKKGDAKCDEPLNL